MSQTPAPPTAAQLADPAWCEAQYNPRLTVSDPLAILARYADWAAQSRAALPFRTLSYGDGAREVLDYVPVAKPRGLIAYIHGGYWRAQHKDDYSWVADTFHAAGYSVAVITYPLCPDVTIRDIVGCCEKAIARLWQELSESERARVLVTGHSAGGYLTAAMFAADWRAHGLPASPFVGGVSYSGVFELPPLLNTSMNALIRLTPDQAQDWSMGRFSPRVAALLILAYGADEPGEFHRQSIEQAAHWSTICRPAVPAIGCNHFTIVESLRDPGSQMARLTLEVIAR
ncbi:MAG TPA: alpha/beta hydrolase [Beijerinckiaceae bacterium]|nr:alpha/beta hydrolase [Beijerinckiaceae bacterium]